MAKQYIFNIVLNEKDADESLKIDQPTASTSIKNEDLNTIAAKAFSNDMTAFADKYLNIKRNVWGYNYTLLKHWKKYAGPNAKQELIEVLCKGAREGLLDYDEVPETLKDPDMKFPDLTDQMLVRLSEKISMKSELRNLAVNGFGMEESIVQTQLTNHPQDICTAVYNVLRIWQNTHQDCATAYKLLCKSLNKCKLGNYIKVLE